MIHCLWRAFVVEKLWVCLFTRTSPQLFVQDHKLPVHNRYLRPCRKPEPGPAKDLVPPEMTTKCQYLPICRETEGRVVHSVRFVSESVFPVACWFCSDTFPVPVWLQLYRNLFCSPCLGGFQVPCPGFFAFLCLRVFSQRESLDFTVFHLQPICCHALTVSSVSPS